MTAPKAGEKGAKHQSVYTQVSRFDPGFDPSKCAESVAEGGRSVRSLQCRRKWVVQEEGFGWCKQHSLEEEQKRNAASAARYKAERAADPVARLARLVDAAGTKNQDELVMLILAGRRWMRSFGRCPLHGLVDCNHRCRDYDGELFEGWGAQGIAASRPYLSVTQEEREALPIPEFDGVKP